MRNCAATAGKTSPAKFAPRKFARRTKLLRAEIGVGGLVFKVVDFHRRQLSRPLSIFPSVRKLQPPLNLNKFLSEVPSPPLRFPSAPRFVLLPRRRPSPLPFAAPLSRAPCLSPRAVVNREFTFHAFHPVGATPARWERSERRVKKEEDEPGRSWPRNFALLCRETSPLRRRSTLERRLSSRPETYPLIISDFLSSVDGTGAAN